MSACQRFLPCLLGTALGVLPSLLSAQGIPDLLFPFAERVLAEVGGDPAIVQAVVAHNRQGLSPETIQERDRAWREAEGVTPFMWERMSNPVAFHLHNLQARHPFIVESFVMDNQGALVGLSHKTSDYWQGDEDKFTASFKGGQGALHYSEVFYDDSTDEIMVQISVPVKEGGRAVGAITFGISLDRWERR